MIPRKKGPMVVFVKQPRSPICDLSGKNIWEKFASNIRVRYIERVRKIFTLSLNWSWRVSLAVAAVACLVADVERKCFPLCYYPLLLLSLLLWTVVSRSRSTSFRWILIQLNWRILLGVCVSLISTSRRILFRRVSRFKLSEVVNTSRILLLN